jgi:hypothetical protein
MAVNDELRRIRKEAAVAYFQKLLWKRNFRKLLIVDLPAKVRTLKLR